jgi:hypothetical protein
VVARVSLAPGGQTCAAGNETGSRHHQREIRTESWAWWRVRAA